MKNAAKEPIIVLAINKNNASTEFNQIYGFLFASYREAGKTEDDLKEAFPLFSDIVSKVNKPFETNNA